MKKGMIGRLVVLLVAVALAVPGFCAEGKKIKVITTLFPLYDFARNVGGEKAEVSMLLPPGVEPHEFEPSAGEILKVGTADIFVYTGRFMEPWAAEVVKGVNNPRLLVVDASAGVALHKVTERNCGGKTVEAVDPHIWLDLGNAQVMVNNILTAFIKKDPGNKACYEKNARDYSARLAALDEAYRTELARCPKKTFIQGGHYTFGYLARRYGLRYISAVGLSPNAESRPQDLIALSDQMKQYGVKYVYFEELVSPRMAQTVAKETGAQLLELNGAHNVTKDEMKKGTGFIEIMERNLKNLKIGLGCK